MNRLRSSLIFKIFAALFVQIISVVTLGWIFRKDDADESKENKKQVRK